MSKQEKNLVVVSGLCWRDEDTTMKLMEKIDEGQSTLDKEPSTLFIS